MSTHVSSPAASGTGDLVLDPHLEVDPAGPSGAQDSKRPARASRSNTLQNVKDKENKGHAKTTPTVPPAVGLDPLSTQIYLRTSNAPEPTIAQRFLPNRPESPTERPSIDTVSPLDARRKGSILSRLGMRTAWRKDEDVQDSDSELGELRTEGSSARALTSVVGAGGGYIPLHKEPTRYIRVRPHNKKEREFNHLFLAQELLGTKPEEGRKTEEQGRAPAIAVGKRLLRGGGDAIWAAEFSVDGRYLAVAGKDQMVRVFSVISTAEERKAHEEEEAQRGDGGEKLSAPVFRTKPVREFHGHVGEVLALSWSKNNFLLSSSMDKTVRLWHMSREDCLCTFKHSDIVTSIVFHPTDDRFFLAGSMDGQLRLWSIPDKSVAFTAPTSDFITAVAFSPDGKTAICGLLSGICMFFETEGMKPQFQIHVRSSRGKNAKGSKITGIRTVQDQDVKVLISSNDSRVRVYNFKTRILEIKFKGLENQSSQIHARFSDDGKYVISGSEDRKAYIWGLNDEVKDRQPYECFDAHPEVVTTALMAPVKTRQLLSASGDPLYDLCNPPPVKLVSLDERSTSLTSAPETPAFIERSKHLDGNIIITTDRTGTIKVFRQDCAFIKRQQNLWETGSRFSGKFASVGRSGSVITKASTGSRVQSRRESLNLGPPAPTQDRINSWRQDIGTPTRTERSLSPMKRSTPNLASDARKQPYAPSLRPPASPSASRRTSVRADDTQPPTPSFSLISASDSDHDDKGSGFWNISRWKGISGLRNSVSSIPVIGSPDSLSPHVRPDRRKSSTEERTGATERARTDERVSTDGRRSTDEGRRTTDSGVQMADE